MSKVEKLNGETSYVTDRFTSGFNDDLRSYLETAYAESARRRHRLCFHQNTEVSVHDIIIEYDSNSYIPPNKHIGKAETLCILQGRIEVFFFSDDGTCFKKVVMGPEGNDVRVCRIPMNTWHGLRVISDEPCIMKETISGPYSKDSLMWAEFAPTESMNIADGTGFSFYERLSKTTEDCQVNDRYLDINENTCVTTAAIPCVRKGDIDRIIDLAHKSPLKRARICLHGNNTEALQDMIIYLAKGCVIPISYHINKDESLVVLEGSGRYDFHYDDSTVSCSVGLMPFKHMSSNSNTRCFTRINRFVPHSIIVGDEGILIYETTSGPFNRDDTAYKVDSQQ